MTVLLKFFTEMVNQRHFLRIFNLYLVAYSDRKNNNDFKIRIWSIIKFLLFLLIFLKGSGSGRPREFSKNPFGGGKVQMNLDLRDFCFSKFMYCLNNSISPVSLYYIRFSIWGNFFLSPLNRGLPELYLSTSTYVPTLMCQNSVTYLALLNYFYYVHTKFLIEGIHLVCVIKN